MHSLYIFNLSILVSVALGATPYFKELESLNPAQKGALEKLKLSVLPFVPHDYMKEDIYLEKWLQVAGFNVRRAEDMLRETIKWRHQNKVDKWADPSFFVEFRRKSEFQSYHDGWDREGRPVAEAFFGDWPVRAFAIRGNLKRLTDHALNDIEISTIRVRQAQTEGKNITQLILLINMDGFNIISQGCPMCLPFYLRFVSEYEKYWPNTVYRAILINTPPSFEIILNAIRPLMSPQSRAALRVFGTNRNEWKPFLDKLIDPREISDWFDPRGKERKH